MLSRVLSHAAVLVVGTLVLAAASGAAEVVAVRVGNHPTFTRVVFQLDHPAGYKIERHTTEEGAAEILVTLEAGSTPRSITSSSVMVERVAVQDGRDRAVAHIRLRKQPSRVKEMILADPPRLVFDLVFPESQLAAIQRAQAEKSKARAAALAAAAKPKAPAPEAAKPEVSKAETAKPEASLPQAEAPAPKPEPAPTPQRSAAALPKPVPPTPAAPPLPKPAAEPKTLARPVPAPKPSPAPEAAKPSPAPEAGTAPLAVTPLAKPEVHEPAPAPEKAMPEALAPKPLEKPAPRELAAQKPGAPGAAVPEQPTPEAPAARPGAGKPPTPAAGPAGETGEATAPGPEAAPERAQARPTPFPKPAAQPAPAPRPASPSAGGIPWTRWGVPVAGALLLALLFVLWLRRRSLPNDLDVTALAEDAESDEFAMGGAPESAASQETFPSPFERPAAAPRAPDIQAGPGLFDEDSEKESETMDLESPDLPVERSASEMPTQMGVGAAAAAASGGGDVARLVRELERRVAQLETRLDESVDARERLERQVAAQAEELRVQRAAIARTQRALRSLNRGEEEQATEPALREPK